MKLNKISGKIILMVLLGFCSFFISSSFGAEKNITPRVLILRSTEPDFVWTNLITQSLEGILKNKVNDISIEVNLVDFGKINKEINLPNGLNRLKQQYSKNKYDVITCVDDESFFFVLKYRDLLFKEIPWVFCGLTKFDPAILSGQTNLTGVVVPLGVDTLLKTIIHLHPKAELITVVFDNSKKGITNQRIFSDAIPNFVGKRKFKFLYDLNRDSLSLFKNLSPNSPVLLIGQVKGKNNKFMEDDNTAELIRDYCKLPVYKLFNTSTKYENIFCSDRRKFATQGVVAGSIIKQILKGKDINSLPIQYLNNIKLIFDARQLEDFGLKQEDLPKGATYTHLPFSFLSFVSQNIKFIIQIFAGIVFLLAVILVLLINIRKRKNVEKELREGKERLNLALMGSEDGIWDWNVVNDDLYFSPRSLEILGFTSGGPKFNMENLLSVISPEDRVRFNEDLQHHLSGRTLSFFMEFRIISGPGIIKYLLCKGKAVSRDDSGKVQRMCGTLKDISERKNLEVSLSEKDRKQRELIDLLPQIVFEIDFKGNLTFSNSNAYSAFRVTKEECENGINVLDFIAPEERNKVIENFQKRIDGNKTGSEYTALRKDGTTFPIMIHASPIFKNQQPIGLRGIMVDITEQKNNEEALRESEERYRALVENQSEGVIIINTEGKFIYANPAANLIFGVNDSMLIGQYADSFMEQNYFNQIQSATENRNFEVNIIRPDGEIRIVKLKITPFIKNGGKVIGSYGVLDDITEQKRNEEQIRKLTQAVYQSPNSIVITDINGIIEFVNPKFTNLTGYSYEETIGRNPNILKSGLTSPKEYQKLWSAIRSGKEWKGEFQNKKKNGELFWESVLISPIINSENIITHFLAVKEDITERIKAQKELIIAKEKAEKSDSLKSEFLAQMSHEIRTPLNAILSFTALLKEELADSVSEDLRPSFRIIDNGGRRLIRTIDLILNMSQVQSGSYELHPSILNLGKDIIEVIMLEFTSMAKDKKLNFRFSNNCQSDKLVVDLYTCMQIFTNLIDNAIKFTHSGSVEILSYNNANNDICVEVRDTGVGIAEDYLPSLFEFFSQEETGYTRKFEGNGLGLALVKKYIELNNAELKVESTKGTGSVFTVILKRNFPDD